MALQRIRLKNFDKRLYLNSPVDQIPQEALRRARGVGTILTESIRSRWGSTKLYDIANANCLFKYDGDRFVGTTAGVFYRNGTSIKTGLSGARLTAVAMPSTPGTVDYLFVAGGGELFKVDGNGNVSTWGISTKMGYSANYILQSDCSSLTGWLDYDVGDGVSTQTTFDSKSCFKLAFSTLNSGYALRRYASLTAGLQKNKPKQGWVELDVYVDQIKVLATTGEYVRVSLSLGGTLMHFNLVLAGSTATTTNTITIPAMDTWYNIKIFFDLKTLTYEYYLNGVLTQYAQDLTYDSDYEGTSYVEVRLQSVGTTIAPLATVYLDNVNVISDQAAAARSSLSTTDIQLCNTATDWTNSGFQAVADEGTIKIEGTNSCKLTLNAGTTGRITYDTTLDLTSYTSGSTNQSVVEDDIALYVLSNHVNRISMFKIEFSLGDTTFNTTYYRRIGPSYTDSVDDEAGVADVADDTDIVVENPDEPSANDSILTEAVTDATLPSADRTWKRITIPKNTFTLSDRSSTSTWADVKAVRISIASTKDGSVLIYLDQIQMAGGAGLKGRYIYNFTFKNSITGHRSNKVGRAVITSVKRHPVSLTNIPQPYDTQVDFVEIWRTVGNGSVLFKVADVPVGTTTYLDEVADCYALDSRPSAKYLDIETRPFDNIDPERNFSFVCGPHNASCFWLSSETGKKGRVYYSAVGRAESLDGYIVVTSDEDAIQSLVMFNGALYAVSLSRWFVITGTNPYAAQEVYKIPGTAAPRTVVATPYGVVYQAPDGIRLFNGTSSELGTSHNILRLFQGEALENLSAFEGVVACGAKGEYIVASSTNTLAANGESGSWRDLGLTVNALCYEPDVDKVMIATSTKVLTLEDEGVYSDDGTAISFAVDTAGLRQPDDYCWLVDGIEVDANTGNNTLAVSALVDGTAVSLGNLQTSTRSGYRWPVGYLCHYVQARFTGSLTTAQAEIFGVAFDLQRLELVIRVAGGSSLEIPGRLSYARDYVTFRIDDWSQLHPTKRNLHWGTLYVEADPNSVSLVPTLYFADETLTLAAVPGSTRDYFTYPVDRLGRLKEVRLVGSFSSAIELRRVELDTRA